MHHRCGSMLRPGALKRWPFPVRHSRWVTTAASHQDQPLRVLFCGSDDFSVASLRALHEFSQKAESNILSIDVAARADKPSGRGLKKLKSPLIKSVAEELGLPLHQLQTFKGWVPPEFKHSDVPFVNLVIAVSFGLLIPARIINGAAFGGLNVHPSLLPDLKGAAPLNWAIIKGYSHTGVSVQTLHPTRFDEGVVLAQTDMIPIQQDTQIHELREKVSPIGADLLIRTIRDKKYLQPYHPVGSQQTSPITFAPKITSAAKSLGFLSDDLPTMLRKNRAIPKLFTYASAKRSDAETKRVRIVLGTGMREASPGRVPPDVILNTEIGRPFVFTKNDSDPLTTPCSVYMVCTDQRVLEIPLLLIEGAKERPASQAAASKGLLEPHLSVGQHRIYQFIGIHDYDGMPRTSPESVKD